MESTTKPILTIFIILIIDNRRLKMSISEYKKTKNYSIQKKLIEATKFSIYITISILPIYLFALVMPHIAITPNEILTKSDSEFFNVMLTIQNIILFIFLLSLLINIILVIYDFIMGIRFRVSKKYKEIFEAIAIVSTVSVWNCIFLHSFLNIIDDKQ